MTAWVLLAENLLFPFAALAFVLRFALSPRRRHLLGLASEMRERLGLLGASQLGKLSGRRVLWVHAASAGEVSAVAGLLERIRRRPQAPAILVTCTTTAGRDKARGLAAVDLAVLAPLDFYPPVNRFLALTKPKWLLIAETELWPHMIELSWRRGVGIALVNGRLTARSFGRMRLFKGLVAPFLRRIGRLAVQTEADADRYLKLGVESARLTVCGNMKYDQAKPLGNPAPALEFLDGLGWEGLPLFVAGSTHPGEEEIVLSAFAEARKALPEARLVIAPRHVERSGQTANLLLARGFKAAAWSKGPSQGADALLLDALGVLPHFYAYASVSFVGGTLVPVGGHNLLEPALAGSPVVFGPHTFHTPETAALLENAGGGFRAADAGRLSEILRELLADPAKAAALGQKARQAAGQLAGATDRTLVYIEAVLEPSHS